MISITLSYIITSATLMLASFHLNQALERFALNYIIPSDKQINYNKKQQLLFLMQMSLSATFLINLKITLLQYLFNCMFIFLLLLLARIDRHYFLLPDRLTYTVLWLALAISPLNFISPIASIYGAGIGYSSLFIINAVYSWFQNREGIGRGDCKLFAALGALLGWQALPITLTLATLLALICSAHLVLFNRNWRQTEIPFGSYLCYSGIMMLLYKLYSLSKF